MQESTSIQVFYAYRSEDLSAYDIWDIIKRDQRKIHVEEMKFAGGEIQVRLDIHKLSIGPVGQVFIYSKATSSDEILKIALVKNAIEEALRKEGILKMPDIVLYMPYLPYARQDRAAVDGEANGIKVMANLINAMNFDQVVVADAHSNVAPPLINNLVNFKRSDILNELFFLDNRSPYKNIVLVSPDEGASKKVIGDFYILKNYESVKIHPAIIQMRKKRDPKTMDLSGFRVDGELSDELKMLATDSGTLFLVTDDICDGGRTFTGLLQPLKEALGVEKIRAGLFVTHGIFSRGLDNLYGPDKYEIIVCPFPWIEDNRISKELRIATYE